MCLWVSYMKKYEFFCILKVTEDFKESDPDPDSISQRYGSANQDPHQNVTDVQHCFWLI